jgi:hypothetical protein
MWNTGHKRASLIVDVLLMNLQDRNGLARREFLSILNVLMDCPGAEQSVSS